MRNWFASVITDFSPRGCVAGIRVIPQIGAGIGKVKGPRHIERRDAGKELDQIVGLPRRAAF